MIIAHVTGEYAIANVDGGPAFTMRIKAKSHAVGAEAAAIAAEVSCMHVFTEQAMAIYVQDSLCKVYALLGPARV